MRYNSYSQIGRPKERNVFSKESIFKCIQSCDSSKFFKQGAVVKQHLQSFKKREKPQNQFTYGSKRSQFQFEQNRSILQLKLINYTMLRDEASNLSTNSEDCTVASSLSIVGKRQANKKWKRINKSAFSMKKPSKLQQFNSSVWTHQQNKAYMQFLAQNAGLFLLSKLQKRDIKINVLMSKAVKSRTADQCRSHHQKMMKYHNSISNIVAHIAAIEEKLDQEHSFTAIDSNYMGNYQLKDLMMEDVDFEPESFCEGLMRGGEINF